MRRKQHPAGQADRNESLPSLVASALPSIPLHSKASITIFWKVNHVDTTICDFSSLCAHRQHCRRYGYWSLVWRWLEDEARYKTGMLPLLHLSQYLQVQILT
jgi:hypothetical protein